MTALVTRDVRERFPEYLARYREGVWRDRVFFDMIVDGGQLEGKHATILDIGCGHGFDGDLPLQEAMGRLAGRFIGIEPDTQVKPGPWFHETHACLLENAPLAPDSIDCAYAIMVLEHLAEPAKFWNKVHTILKPGGVFWGLTVDARHLFCTMSRWFERLRLKDWYLNLLMGKRGEARYENYPVFYRSNTPDDVAKLAAKFTRHTCFNLSREGQCDGYYPGMLRPMARWLDRRAIRQGRPGTLLVVRAEK